VLALVDDIDYIVPPGSPSGSKIASHTYLKTAGGAKIPIYAPADSVLIDGSFGEDYGLTFHVSCEVFYILGHITEPIDAIKNAVDAWDGENPILMEFKAGDLLAYTSGTVAINVFDFGLYNINHSNEVVNSARYTAGGWSKDYNADCPYDYFADGIKSGYYNKFATLGGTIVPGAACRGASQDVAGSIAGAWFDSSVVSLSAPAPERLIIGTELDGGVIRIGRTDGGNFPFIYSSSETYARPRDVTTEHCYSYSTDNQIAYFRVVSDTEMDAYFSSSTSTCPSAFPASGSKRYYR